MGPLLTGVLDLVLLQMTNASSQVSEHIIMPTNRCSPRFAYSLACLTDESERERRIASTQVRKKHYRTIDEGEVLL